MKHIYYRAAFLLLPLVLSAMTGCSGGSSQPAAVSGTAHPTVAKTATSNSVSCTEAEGTIQLLVTGQQKFEASQQSVSDGVQYIVVLDEGIAIIKVRNWAGHANELSQDLARFETDANAFTNGGTDQPQAVESDVDKLAADCDVPETDG